MDDEDVTYWCNRCGSLCVIDGRGCVDYCGECGSCDIAHGTWDDYMAMGYKDGGGEDD